MPFCLFGCQIYNFTIASQLKNISTGRKFGKSIDWRQWVRVTMNCTKLRQTSSSLCLSLFCSLFGPHNTFHPLQKIHNNNYNEYLLWRYESSQLCGLQKFSRVKWLGTGRRGMNWMAKLFELFAFRCILCLLPHRKLRSIVKAMAFVIFSFTEKYKVFGIWHFSLYK